MILPNVRDVSMLLLRCPISQLGILLGSLKFSSYVDLPPINKMFKYRYAWKILSMGTIF